MKALKVGQNPGTPLLEICKDSVLLDPLTPMLIGGSRGFGGGGANNFNGTFYGYYGITDHTQGKLAGTT